MQREDVSFSCCSSIPGMYREWGGVVAKRDVTKSRGSEKEWRRARKIGGEQERQIEKEAQ